MILQNSSSIQTCTKTIQNPKLALTYFLPIGIEIFIILFGLQSLWRNTGISPWFWEKLH